MEMEMEMEMEKTMYIPNDIMVRILLRVPASSLFRLRGTCKYWLKLITRDDDFIKMHLHHSTTSHDLSVLISRLVASSSKGDKQKNFQCYLNCTTASLSNPIAYPFKSYYGRFTCINGLVFGLINEELGKFCIWNPCTNDYRVVPNSLKYCSRNNVRKNRVVHKYGFGYDHTVNDYKVVRTDCYNDGNGNYFATQVQIYSLARNSWRSIGPYPYQLGSFERSWECGILVNGALYWMHSSKEKIISFDIVKEKYKEVSIKQPKCSHGNWDRIELQAFEGSLCMQVLVTDPRGYWLEFEIWTMRDQDLDKNEYSWTNKLFGTRLFDFYSSIPLRLTKNGEILMLKQHRQLVLWDLKTGTTSKICMEEEYYKVDAVYIESLVSLNSFMNLPNKKTIM